MLSLISESDCSPSSPCSFLSSDVVRFSNWHGRYGNWLLPSVMVLTLIVLFSTFDVDNGKWIIGIAGKRPCVSNKQTEIQSKRSSSGPDGLDPNGVSTKLDG
ncbi:hypothetical protein BLOT_009976 [Blomia tropicalis]|nr:hypothetical protein BLOT_009976 [Blomia tropicalis]